MLFMADSSILVMAIRVTPIADAIKKVGTCRSIKPTLFYNSKLKKVCSVCFQQLNDVCLNFENKVSTYVCVMYLNPKLVRTYIQVGGEIYVCVAQKRHLPTYLQPLTITEIDFTRHWSMFARYVIPYFKRFFISLFLNEF